MFRLSVIRKNCLAKLLAIALTVVVSLVSITQFFLLPLPVFAFHGIVDRNHPDDLPSRASPLDYPLQDLEKLLTYLIENDYWFLSTPEFYDYFVGKSKSIPTDYQKRKPIMLTFDDGYRNIDAYVLPLLQKLQKNTNNPLKIVLFINPSNLKRDDSNKSIAYLNCADLRRGMELGLYDVQSHGYSHIDLTRTMPNQLEFELSESQRSLKECTINLRRSEIVAQHIAYPYNKVNRNVKKMTSSYYQSGYRFNSRLRHLLILTNPFGIPRIGVSQNDSPETLIQLSRRYSN